MACNDDGALLTLGMVGALAAAGFVRRGSASMVLTSPMGFKPQRRRQVQESLTDVLAALRALKWDYWTDHWQSHGSQSYSDHLLFERLYTQSIDTQIDTLGEKMVAYFGSGAVDSPASMQRTLEFVHKWGKTVDPVARALTAEHDLQVAIVRAYKMINKDVGEQSKLVMLGIDNYLSALADEHETNLYLLQQRNAL